MHEEKFREDLNKSIISDNAAFDRFASQFTGSLEKEGAASTKEQYWHGRLIGMGLDKADVNQETLLEYSIDFIGNGVIEEDDWREALDNGDIVVNKFFLTGEPTYLPEVHPGHLDPHLVVCTARFEGSVKGVAVERNVLIRHHIRRTYIAHRTDVTFI